MYRLYVMLQPFLQVSEEPLAAIEIQKVAEEVAHEGAEKAEELAKLLNNKVSEETLQEIRTSTNVTELQRMILNLLQEWLRSKEGNEQTATSEAQATPRRLLVRHLHTIKLKLTGEG